MLRIFTPVKIQRLRPGLNPQTWVPEASMLTITPPKPSILSYFRENLNFSYKFSKKKIFKFHEISPVGDKLFHADGQK